MKIIADVQVYLTTNPKEADEFREKIHICRNCTNYTQTTLFDGICSGYGDCEPFCPPFNVDYNAVCECFSAKEKKIEYWLRKLGIISMDYNGTSDEVRSFFAKENNKPKGSIKPL